MGTRELDRQNTNIVHRATLRSHGYFQIVSLAKGKGTIDGLQH